MKKQYMMIAVLSVMAVVLTGCSWEDFAAKFTGSDMKATGGAIEIEDYDPEELVELGVYKGVEVDCTVKDDEVQSAIDTLIQNNTNPEQIKKGKAKKGQSVNINYVGKVNGKKFDGGEASDVSITLGSSGYIDGFDEGVIGMKPGETKDLHLKFPKDYHEENLAGKKVIFTVKLNYIEGKDIVPKFTDDFVKEKSEYKTVAEYKEKTKANLAQDKKDRAPDSAMQTVLSEAKVDENKIPASLIEVEKKQIDQLNRAQIASMYGDANFDEVLTSMGMTKEQYDESLKQYAVSSAKTQLVIEAIAAKENIPASESDIKNYISEMIKKVGMSEEDYRSEFTKQYGDSVSFEDFMKTAYLYEKVRDLIGKNVKYKE